MVFPIGSLHDEESVLVAQHPHWAAMSWPILVASSLLGGIAAGFVLWKSAPTWFGIVLGLLLLFDAGYGLGKYWSWRSRVIVVTTHRVVHTSGALRRETKEIALRSIQDVTTRQGIWQRAIGNGTLLIESAGGRGAEVVENVKNPARVQAMIGRASEAPRRREITEIDNKETDRPSPPVERLDQLRRQGIITDAEFAAMRSSLGESN